jgi:hypothetical protein
VTSWLLIILGSMALVLPLQAANWEAGPGYRSISLTPGPAGKTGFALLAPASTGVVFTNLITDRRHLTNQILLNGSGVAAGDVDGDGWCDLYFCSIDGPNVLYRNLGNWTFQDITESAGVACPDLDATGAAFVDIDGDGDLDLIVNSVGGGTHIFLNDGKGHFTKLTELNGHRGGMSLALGDVDGDGFLDLYIANYRTSSLMDMPNARATFKIIDGKNTIQTVNGRPMTAPDLTNRFYLGAQGQVLELGEADSFYHNQGGTNFVEIPFTGGTFLDEDGHSLTAPPLDWGLSVMIRDLNGDGLPDIYVCNDFETPDRMWLNLGGGRFQAAPRLALRKTSQFSMGVDVADINHDGYDDIFVLDMLYRGHTSRITQMISLPPAPEDVQRIDGRPQYMMSTLFLNRGDGTYAEIAQLSGLDASDWSWLPIFLDVDLDGWEDLLVVNGHERAARDLDVADQLRGLRRTRRLSDAEIFQARRAFPRSATANLAFRNRGDLTFEEVGQKWGFDFKGVSQGMALVDLDNDGDLDVVINNSNQPACVYRNDAGAPRIAIRLNGLPPNTHGIGAKVKVLGGAVPSQAQEIICGGRYLSCDQAMRVFAAGTLTNQMRIEVTWRNGKRSVVEPAYANRLYEIDERGAEVVSGQSIRNTQPEPQNTNHESRNTDHGSQTTDHGPRTADNEPRTTFQDLSEQLNHTHHDEPFNDFSRQPLLPNRLSQLGPGVSWFDVNGDGWEDLIIASGKGGTLAVYTNDNHGAFNAMKAPPLTTPVTRDQTAVLGWNNAAGHCVLLSGSANYEDGLAFGGVVRPYDLAQATVDDTFPSSPSSTGPLALGDIDGDHKLELFVGGRCLPGKYPERASSALYRNTGSKFQLDVEASKAFADVGLVSGAVFSDLDGDGLPDLVLACDWGPIRIFRNVHGTFVEATEALGMDKFKGWWNGVTTGDFDGDGRPDIVASNWGRNTPYQSHRGRPLMIFYGDFDGDGTEDIIEAYYDIDLQKLVPERPFTPMAQAMPFLRGRFGTHRAYGQASVEELLGDSVKAAKHWEADWLESTLFLNRGDHFEAKPLPVEAQTAPAFGVSVADLDGDGYEDLFLSQNFFDSEPETPRYDAGRGLWLRGDGHGGFTAVRGQDCGIKIYGEQRGCAVCDFDHDGRTDLVVTQNSAPTKLYHNLAGKPGLRVQLEGPPENRNAVGASIRLAFGEQLGPAREIHAGSGYWSQDAACQVLALPTEASAVLIRWPGGKQTRSALRPGATEVRIDTDGRLQVIHGKLNSE